MFKKRFISFILAFAMLFQFTQPVLAQSLVEKTDQAIVETVSESEAESVEETKAESVEETQAETAVETKVESVEETQAETVVETKVESVEETQAESMAITQEPAVDTIKAEAKTLTILHYNDSHGRYKYEADKTIGYAKAKTIIDQQIAQGPTLVLDAGDTVHGTNFATLSEGDSIVSLMDMIGLDAFVPGNHDFNYGSDRLVELANKATNFDVLSSNVIKEDGTKLFDSHMTYDKDGVKVGVFAASTPETVYKSHPDNTRGLNFDNVVVEAQKSIEALKAEGAEVIVFLSHLGTDKASQVNTYTVLDALTNSADIDVVIDGHSHTLLPNGEAYKDSFIASTGQYFENIGKTVITINADGTKSVVSSMIPASSVAYVAENAEVSQFIAQAEAANDEVLSEVIGNTATVLDGERPNVRSKETNGADLVTDAIMHATGADAVITNGGGIRASIDAGEITMNEALTVLPFGNLVTVIKVTGQDILDALTHGVSGYPNPAGNFPQVSGIEFTIKPTAEGNQVKDAKIGGQALDLAKTYELATNDFMAVGGDGYTMFEGKLQVALFESMLEIYANYIKKLSADGPFTYETDGRIKVETLPVDEVKQDVPSKLIKEVNAHVGAEAQTSQNISWVTVEETQVDVKVIDENGNEVVSEVVNGTSNGNVFTYTKELTGLTANTKYTYILENEFNREVGEFKTAVENTSDKTIRFGFIADPQVNTAQNAEATGAVFNYLAKESEENPLDFLYLAGDHTDHAGNEQQWHDLFHNGGLFPNATQDFLKKHTLLSTQGNHDSIDLAGHINQPEELGEGEFLQGVYSVDYGNLRFVVLNNASYNVADLENNANFNKMIDFLKQEITDAKSKGMWTAVGFHKPIYTGASHVSDGDVIEYRKALNPVFSELDIDMILTGHDHVYSRGFVNAEGRNATVENEELTAQNGVTTYSHVKGAPIHVVAEHAGGLKWYSPVNYPITNGDLIVPNYGFLDKNSATQDDPLSYVSKKQTYVVVEASADQVEFKTHKLKYQDGQMLEEPYLYDNFIITKDVTKEPVIETGELTDVILKADNTKLNANNDETSQLSLTYYDQKYNEL